MYYVYRLEHVHEKIENVFKTDVLTNALESGLVETKIEPRN